MPSPEFVRFPHMSHEHSSSRARGSPNGGARRETSNAYVMVIAKQVRRSPRLITPAARRDDAWSALRASTSTLRRHVYDLMRMRGSHDRRRMSRFSSSSNLFSSPIIRYRLNFSFIRWRKQDNGVSDWCRTCTLEMLRTSIAARLRRVRFLRCVFCGPSPKYRRTHNTMRRRSAQRMNELGRDGGSARPPPPPLPPARAAATDARAGCDARASSRSSRHLGGVAPT